ncbi:MAG: hypothetical protein OXG59_11815 [Gammaproteobacteria bacterium]|nr:hypothetical protein [Gammaproteobacteria bacterium]MCY3941009.1 hypothetical protein [Gammaproteobacteria bacterium]
MTTTLRIRRNRRIEDLPPGLPGAELVGHGIAALERGERTIEALLVSLAAPRLRDIGLDVPRAADHIAEPNLALYAAVRHSGGDHFDYNALLGRLSSFADAAEWMLGRPAGKTA